MGRQRPWDHKQLSPKPDSKLGSLSQSCTLSYNPPQSPVHAAGCVSIKDSVLGHSWCRLTESWCSRDPVTAHYGGTRISAEFTLENSGTRKWNLTADNKSVRVLFSAFMWVRPWLVTLPSPVSLCDPRQSSAVVTLWECPLWVDGGCVCAGPGLRRQRGDTGLCKSTQWWGGEVDPVSSHLAPELSSFRWKSYWPEYADRMAATFFLFFFFFSIFVLLFNCI